MMLLAMGLWTDNEKRELIRLAITYLGVDGLLLNFIQEYVTGHAAIARAHDVSHRACLACSSNVPRFWSDYFAVGMPPFRYVGRWWGV